VGSLVQFPNGTWTWSLNTTGLVTQTVTIFATDSDGAQAQTNFLLTVFAAADFNRDGLLNCADIDALVAAISGGANPSAFDLTGDGSVNSADRNAWLAEAGNANLGPGRAYRLGDANLDSLVDGSDFNIWNSNKFTMRAEWCRGDFSADGVIDGSDFNLWNSNKFTSSDASRPWMSVVIGAAEPRLAAHSSSRELATKPGVLRSKPMHHRDSDF
jgi:hypothetical protein